MPTFRTQAGFGAYVEGWGLYTEWLATEMPGTYEDPYSEFGRLGSEIWRAIRLVVDTGLHSKGWSEEQAVSTSSRTPCDRGRRSLRGAPLSRDSRTKRPATRSGCLRSRSFVERPRTL